MYSAFYFYPDVSGPLNGDARELKYCECCGYLFVTSRDRYCRRCHANPVPLGKNVTVEVLEELMRSETAVMQ